MSNGEYGVIGPLLYLIKITNLEVSDTTGDDKRTKAGKKINT